METVKQVDLNRKKGVGNSVEEQNKKLVRLAVEEIWNKGDYTLLKDLLASSFVFHSLNPDNEVRGSEGVQQYYRSLRSAFPDLKFTIIDQVAEGNKVATRWIAEGTHLGNFQGIPPTGKSFKVSAIDIDHIHEGKFTDCWTNMDELGLLQQLGLVNNEEHGEEPAPPEAWDEIADGYDKYVTDTEVWLANEALKRVGLQAGHTFLDVAAGCGGLSLPAARMGAVVTATDWSPEMIRLFEMRVRKENLANAQGRVMDAHHLEFDNDLFDITGSQFGVMLLPDQPQAIKEMVRVTKPGGKVVLIGYGNPEKIDFLNFFIKALQSVEPHFEGLPTDHPPLEFQIADPEVLKQRLAAAGLNDVKVDTVTEKLEFNSGQQLWDWTINGNPIVGHVLKELNITDEQIEIIKERLDQMLRERADTSGKAILTDPVNIGYGTK